MRLTSPSATSGQRSLKWCTHHHMFMTTLCHKNFTHERKSPNICICNITNFTCSSLKKFSSHKDLEGTKSGHYYHKKKLFSRKSYRIDCLAEGNHLLLVVSPKYWNLQYSERGSFKNVSRASVVLVVPSVVVATPFPNYRSTTPF